MSAGAAAVPMPLAVGAETVSPVVFQDKFAPVVSPLAEEGAFRVGMVGLVEAGSDVPVELLHSEHVLPDCGFSDVGVLVPEMSPVVSAGGAAVLMSLPAVTEVFSIFAGGGVVADAATLADVGTGTDGVSVLPDAGSELPADSVAPLD